MCNPEEKKKSKSLSQEQSSKHVSVRRENTRVSGTAGSGGHIWRAAMTAAGLSQAEERSLARQQQRATI